MKLFHGTYEKTVPIIKLGEFAMSGNKGFQAATAEISGMNHGSLAAANRGVAEYELSE
ncbi:MULTISPECIES: hypothetical protein [Enterobacteriaceae]|uniref:hypothetical protein n=1 Tax=Enterobacteriaceae TaxID=543 RepID=UPI00147F1EF1|nr:MULTISPECIES: hypothetical protein [Enterobacteriaceae]EFK6687478.1 hypothetical protein [Escherichia coli]EFL6459154.1 hypothetical protein [Escherichia coli]HBD0265195.1 hypothetical protein [Escherichia coli]HBD0337267.1 hypothetical protein [Escherichia coli]